MIGRGIVAGGFLLAGAALAQTPETAVLRGVRLDVVPDAGVHAVRVNGREVARHEAFNVGIAAAIDDVAADRAVFLLFVNSGGSACPGEFQIVLVQAGRVSASPTFGTCTDFFRIERGRELTVTIPAYRNLPSVTARVTPGGVVLPRSR